MGTPMSTNSTPEKRIEMAEVDGMNLAFQMILNLLEGKPVLAVHSDVKDKFLAVRAKIMPLIPKPNQNF
ncbi:hypothetical protein BH10BDE1_BH10BDE1_25930 [soil metagenome]